MTDPATSEEGSQDPARFVADADVLAADLLVGGPARAALDLARAHDWVTLVASEALLDETEAVIGELADEGLAADWRERIEDLAVLVDHHPGDHPALASAQAGDVRHLLSFDTRLHSAQTNVSLQGRLDISIRSPDAFVSLFDPESMYEVVVGGTYPGPDRDPRG